MGSSQTKKLLKLFIPIGVVGLVILFIFLWRYRPNYYQPVQIEPAGQSGSVETNTIRIKGEDAGPVEMAIAISQTVYPATFKDNKAGAVILVREDQIEEATAAIGLIHHPIDAPILYVKEDSLPEATRKELERLGPEGVMQDGNVQVYLVGDIKDKIKDEIKKSFKTRSFQAENIHQLAYKIDQYKSVMHADHTDDVILADINHPEYYLTALAWIAHMGSGLAFVDGEKIPEETRQILAERPQDAFIYLMGPPDIISQKVAGKLIRYGHVQRIPGDNPFKSSVGFAGYKDIGPNFGWWIGKSTRSFGWGVAEAGHNFIFGNVEDIKTLIPAAVLSHRGKHGPLLIVKKAQLPDGVKKYLQTTRPTYIGVQEQLFNHGWILNDGEQISDKTRLEIDNLLEVKKKDEVIQ